MERQQLIEHIRRFPERPGVYLMHSDTGDIIYVGKAKSLKKRVASYFRHDKFASPRLRKLVSQIKDVSTIRTETEAEALILESKLIKLYQPFYNVELKMGERYPYLHLTEERYPRLVVTRHKPADAKGVYLGPYTKASELREVLRLLERYFPLRICTTRMDVLPVRKRPCMQYALGRCLAPCAELCTLSDYTERVTDALLLLQGKGVDLVERLRKRMDTLANSLRFEEAAKIRDTIKALWRLSRNRLTTPQHPSARDTFWEPLKRLQTALSLPTIPWRIDCFDISHTAGHQTVGVVVVFEQGMPNSSLYRKFNININQTNDIDDFRSMKETLLRSYTRSKEGESPLPQLILIDGGLIQLDFATQALKELNLTIPVISLAERFEEVFVPGKKEALGFAENDSALLLLRRIRDEAHRFAVSSHRKRRGASYSHSILEEISGIGRNKATLLLSRFGSMRGIAALSEEELASTPGIGEILAKRILDKIKENAQ